jgi:hypothetical protein
LGAGECRDAYEDKQADKCAGASPQPFVPAKAGTQTNKHIDLIQLTVWIPACAGMNGIYSSTKAKHH